MVNLSARETKKKSRKKWTVSCKLLDLNEHLNEGKARARKKKEEKYFCVSSSTTTTSAKERFSLSEGWSGNYRADNCRCHLWQTCRGQKGVKWKAAKIGNGHVDCGCKNCWRNNFLKWARIGGMPWEVAYLQGLVGDESERCEGFKLMNHEIQIKLFVLNIWLIDSF